jgi:hypothetical protein
LVSNKVSSCSMGAFIWSRVGLLTTLVASYSIHLLFKAGKV